MVPTRFFGLSCAALCMGLSAPATAQDYSLQPTFGVISVVSGFLPDPNWVGLLAGGPNQGQYTDFNTDGSCVGHFADAPDLRVHYEAGPDYPFAFFVDSQADTVLLVNAPDGAWHCSDDVTGLNPAIEFDQPQSGQYDIWVGTYASAEEGFPDAMLGWTEVSNFGALDLTNTFFGEDERTVLDTTVAPWNMIGSVDIENSGCTGVLVGPSTVVTAGHCVYDQGTEYRAQTFEAGYNQGNFVASSRVVSSHIPDGWRNGEQDGYDFAFLFLADPIGDQLGWMDIGPLAPSEISALQAGTLELLQAGYSYDQPGVLTGHLGCPFVQVTQPNELHHECDTVQGDSGSPLFIDTGAGYRVVGVESHSRGNPDPESPYPLNVAMHTEYVVAELARVEAGGAGTSPVDTKEK